MKKGITRGGIVVITVLLLISLYPVYGQPINSEKPNVLFIMTDQQRFDALRLVQDEMEQYEGKLKIRTPNLDRLAQEGAYFRNAYTPCAVCAPARVSLRTGMTLERHGAQSNGLVSENTYNNTPDLFKDKMLNAETIDQVLVEDRGYVSEYFGKWHMPLDFLKNRAGTANVIRYNHFNYADSSFYLEELDSWGRFYLNYLSYFDSEGDISKTFPEGTQENTFSKYPYYPVQLDVRYGMPTNTPLKTPMFESWETSQPNVMGKDKLTESYTPTGMNGFIALQSLGRLIQEDDPFFLTVSFHNPHAPMVASKKYYDYYYDNREDLMIPPSILDEMENSGYGSDSKLIASDYNDPDKVREWMACYYALVEEVDHWVGNLLDTLDSNPDVRDNTIVLFTSDHGEMLGAHALREKNKFLEESAHIPLLIKAPGKIEENLVVEEIVNLRDVFATLLDYSNVSMNNSDGKSLRRFIEKANYNKDFDEEHIVTEWDFRDPGGTSLLRSLGGEINFLSMKGDYKLMMTKKASSGKIDMLYDIGTDPYELDNLIGEDGNTASDFVIGKTEHLKAMLIDWMTRMDGADELYSDPKWNNYEGAGDIAEIRMRRTWRAMDLWLGDTAVYFGTPVDVEGVLKRNEYLYLGRTSDGTTNVSSVSVEGADAAKFTVSEFISGAIAKDTYERIKIQYLPVTMDEEIDAKLRIVHSTGEDILVSLGRRTYSEEGNVNGELPGSPGLIYPGNGMQGMKLSTKLDWLRGKYSLEHEVYFGTSNPPAYQTIQTGTSFDPGALESNTLYYWQIKEKNDAGHTAGDIWSFKTIGPPEANTGHLPINGTIGVSTTAGVKWTAGAFSESHDVYFGTTNPPPFVKNQPGNSYTPVGPLDFETTYYWKVDAVNEVGKEEGEVLSFTTRDKDASGIVVLNDCDSGSGWGGSNYTGISTSKQKQGTACVVAAGISTNDFQRTFSPAINTGIAEADAQLVFWYYVSDLSKFNVSNQVEIGCGGKADVDEYNWQIKKEDLHEGWNLMQLDFGDANTMDNPNLSTINWFRIYRKKNGGVETRVDNIRIIDTSVDIAKAGAAESPSPADGSENASLTQALSWTTGLNAEFNLLYFGETNPPEYVAETPGDKYTMSELEEDRAYYWRIDGVHITDTTKGDVWLFTTEDGGVGYKGLLANNEFQMFPNPCRGIVKIDVEWFEDAYSIRVYDLQGRLLLQQMTDKKETSLNLTNLDKGNYIVEVVKEGQRTAGMLVVE